MSREPQAVLTERDAILDALADVEPGDELTVEAASGYRDNRTVSDLDDEYIVFGERDSLCRFLHQERGTVHKPGSGMDVVLTASGVDITELVVW